MAIAPGNLARARRIATIRRIAHAARDGIRHAGRRALAAGLIAAASSAAPAVAAETADSGVGCIPEVRGPIAAPEDGARYRPQGVTAPPEGFVDEEFFIECEAQGARYATVVDVRRPLNPREASGSVIVEPTHPGDLWPVRSTVRDYLARARHVTVAVSADPGVARRLVKPAHPERYAAVTVPAVGGMESAILAQLGALLQRGALPGVHADDVILAGYSATGAKVRTYIRERHAAARLADGASVYDGYFPGQTAVGTFPRPIPEIDVPVVELQGERELLSTLQRNPHGLTYRRPDGPRYRLYEVAGMPHVDTRAGPRRADARERCEVATPSRFPLGPVWANALNNLVHWAATGVAAPRAGRLALSEDGSRLERDPHGNAVGGVPVPLIEVPVATYRAWSANAEGYPDARCDMLGAQVPLPPATLERLYGDPAGYVEALEARLDALVRESWYLAHDARALLRTAQSRTPEFQPDQARSRTPEIQPDQARSRTPGF